jgi:hypothetical protein
MTPASQAAIEAMRAAVVELETAHKNLYGTPSPKCGFRQNCSVRAAICGLSEAISGLEREDRETNPPRRPNSELPKVREMKEI